MLNFCAHRALADDDYPIHFERQLHVGDRWHLESTGSLQINTDTVSNGTKTEGAPQSADVKLSAEEEVLAVNERFMVTKVKVTVHSFTLKIGDKSSDLSPADSVLTVTFEAKKLTATENDKPASADVIKFLEGMVPLEDDSETSVDEEIGTTARQKIGGSWPVRADKLAVHYTDGGTKVTAKDVSGSTKLIEIKTIDGQKDFHTDSEITVQNIALPNTPPNLKLDNATGIMDVNIVDPIQPGFPPNSIRRDLTISSQYSGTQDGHAVVIHSKAVQKNAIAFSDFHPAG